MAETEEDSYQICSKRHRHHNHLRHEQWFAHHNTSHQPFGRTGTDKSSMVWELLEEEVQQLEGELWWGGKVFLSAEHGR
jgi:hypothetical protein